jgi:hypothetical protein
VLVEQAREGLQVEFPFTLPCGFVDGAGQVHRDGAMRRATALDEVQPLADPRVLTNQAYVGILLLSRVLTRLGNHSPVMPVDVERLFAADYAFLQDLYVRINEPAAGLAETECPGCGTRFALDLGI